MKKLLFIATVSILSFSSCKEYGCQCVDTTTGLAGDYWTFKASSESSAESNCALHDTKTDSCYLSD